MAETRALLKTFLKSCSLERSSEHSLYHVDHSKVKRVLNLAKEVIPLPDNKYEFSLIFTLTAYQEDKVVYLVEVEYSGLFLLEELSGEDFDSFIEKTAPFILEPYFKAEVNEVLLKAELPLLPLNNLNWD